jgi:polyphosphate kinase
MGSADLMRRNLDRRVEILFPVEDPDIKRKLRDDVIDNYLNDTVDAHELQSDGSYRTVAPKDGAASMSSQQRFIQEHS